MPEMTDRRPLRGVVSGFGNVGQALTRVLHERLPLRARIVGVSDPAPAARAAAVRDFGIDI